MTKVELTHKSMHLMYSFDVQVGELKAKLQAGVWVYKDKGGENTYDCEFNDSEEITYMGVPIEGYQNWKKFREFHKGIGIDFDTALDKEFEKVMTKERLDKLVKEIKF
jgi:hypothetical protein